MLLNALSKVKTTAPVKIISNKKNGILLQAIILQKPTVPVGKKGAVATTSAARSVIESELGGVTGVKTTTTGGKSYTKYEFIIIPQKISKLIDEWMKATPEVRSQLTYAPVFGAEVPTISILVTYPCKPNTKDESTVLHFRIPVNKKEYHLEEGRPCRISVFEPPAVARLPCLVNLVAFGYDAKVGKTFDTEDQVMAELNVNPHLLLATYPEKKWSSISLYPACASITSAVGPLDNLPKEFQLKGYFYNPSFKYNFSLEEINARHKKESPFTYVPHIIPLSIKRELYNADPMNSNPLPEGTHLIMDKIRRFPYSKEDLLKAGIPTSPLTESISELPSGEIVNDPDLTNEFMMTSINFCQQKANQTTFAADIPATYEITSEKITRNFVKAQIAFSAVVNSYSEKEYSSKDTSTSSTTDETAKEDKILKDKFIDIMFRNETLDRVDIHVGKIMCAIWDTQIDECGINNEFRNLMAVHGISNNILFEIYAKNTMESKENNFTELRVDSPAGILEGGIVSITWNVIQYIKKFGIPVTTEWVKKALSKNPTQSSTSGDQSTDKIFYPPRGSSERVNVVNKKNGEDYGFVNISEINPNFSKDEFYDPKNKWNFAILFDYNYSNLSKEKKAELKNLTPEDGVNVMDGLPLKNGKEISLEPKNAKSYIVMAFKYDPTWQESVQKYQAEKDVELSNWRTLRTYVKCFEEFGDLFLNKPEIPYLLHFTLNNDTQMYPEFTASQFSPKSYLEQTVPGSIIASFLKEAEKVNVLNGGPLKQRLWFKNIIKESSGMFEPNFVKMVAAAPIVQEIVPKLNITPNTTKTDSDKNTSNSLSQSQNVPLNGDLTKKTSSSSSPTKPKKTPMLLSQSLKRPFDQISTTDTKNPNNNSGDSSPPSTTSNKSARTVNNSPGNKNGKPVFQTKKVEEEEEEGDEDEEDED